MLADQKRAFWQQIVKTLHIHDFSSVGGLLIEDPQPMSRGDFTLLLHPGSHTITSRFET